MPLFVSGKLLSYTPQVLIVEDEETTALFLQEILSRNRFQPTRARNGAEGLAALLAGRFDIVILDLHMPIMDGFQLLQAVEFLVRKGALRHRPKIVVYSAVENYGQLKSLVNLPMVFGAISKQWAVRELIHVIEEICASDPRDATFELPASIR